MKKFLSTASHLFVLSPFVLVALFVLAAVAFAESTEKEDANVIADLGMPVADLSNPFSPPSTFVGRVIVEGVISDMPVDLDNDGAVERLVVYLAPSVEPSLFRDVDKNILAIKDLRLAVFKQRGGAYVKCADIIISDGPLVWYFYADIRVSVWGNEQKYIYIYDAARPYEGLGITYCVMSFREDRLFVELLLKNAGFTDGLGLYRINLREADNL